MVNKKMVKEVVAKYRLQPDDVETLTKLIKLHHEGSSSEADVAFDTLLDSLEEDSPILQALGEYQKNSVKTLPKWKVFLSVLQVVAGELIKIARMESEQTVRGVFEKGTRDTIIVAITGTEYGSRLHLRMVHTEIGYLSGHVSDIDRRISEDKGLVPLNRFEKWLMCELIEMEKKRRWQGFRQSCIEVLGEDPETDWCMI